MNRTGQSYQQRGFSLMELMIVVVIVGVISAIALPAYTNYTRNAKRADAHQELAQMAQRQERFFTDNNTYATETKQLGYLPAPPDNLAISKGGYWALSITAGGASYALQAVPTGTHSDPECLTITITSAGARGSTPAGNNCWSGK